MKLFGPNEILYEVAEESTISVGADVAELSQEEDSKELDVEVELEEEEQEEQEVGEIEEEQEEEEKEEPKSIHPFERPSIKQLSEAFPDIFKKFPSLKDMYFREAEYSKIFPTVEDAREANENNEAFVNIRSDVFDGDGTKFFSAIKEVDEKGLERFAASILPNLVKIHAGAFWRAANPLVEDICRSMFQDGVRKDDESKQNAARYLSDYFFGNTEIAEGTRTSIIKDTKDSSVSKEREAFEKEKQDAFSNSVQVSAKTDLLALIDGKDVKTGKSRLDPDGIFSPFIRASIIDRITQELGSQLQADKDHIKYMDSLWARAKRSGRTDEDKARIVSAYLARAKSLIPSLRSKYVSEAMGGRSRNSEQRREKVTSLEGRVDTGNFGRASRAARKDYNPKSINYDKTSDEDILNDNISYR